MFCVPNPIRSTALARGQHPVLIAGEETLSAQELFQAVVSVAGQLNARGIKPSDIVGILADSSTEWVVVYHAIGWIGAIAAPFPLNRPLAELVQQIDLLQPQALVLSAAQTPPDLESSIAGARLPRDRIIKFADLWLGTEVPSGPTIEALPERFWPLDESRVAVLTSGTTKPARWVFLSSGQLLFSAFGSAIRLGHDLHDSWLNCLPLHHIGGLSIVTRCAQMGTCVLLHRRFDAERVARELDSGKVTIVSLVPVMLERVLDARRDLPFPTSVRTILVGGAPLSQSLLDRARAIGAPLSVTWGMTETASQVSTRVPGDLSAAGGCGLPLAFARVESHEGRLLVRGPITPEARPLISNDLGEIDPDGQIRVLGRADDIINSGGEKIIPGEVEAVLMSHSAVTEAAVVGRFDPQWGERPVGFVVANKNDTCAAALATWCRDRLASYKIPDELILVDSLPRGELGKLSRACLLELATSRSDQVYAQRVRRGISDPLLKRLAQSAQCPSVEKNAAELHALQGWLAEDLANIEDELGRLSASDKNVAQRAAGHLLTCPGKRVRPLCVLLAARLKEGISPSAADILYIADLALSCELVHAATLLHDDVIDAGTERRGAPTARTLYGNTASILAGDYLLTEALRRIARGSKPRLMTSMLEAISAMVASEALQLEQQHRFDPRPELYLRIVEGKTAALFRWGLEAGATMAGLGDSHVSQAGQVGLGLGIAFQLVDDLLDFEGAAETVGKDTLADLREGKLTWPLLVAARRDPDLAADLRDVAAARDLSTDLPARRAELVERVVKTGALAATRGAVAEQTARSQRALDTLPAGRARDALAAVVEFCARRAN